MIERWKFKKKNFALINLLEDPGRIVLFAIRVGYYVQQSFYSEFSDPF